jgi:2-phospho-L-lactate guanylyltransferase
MLVAIVPVKSPHAAKGRLSWALTQSERRRLCLVMLEDVLSALQQTDTVDRILVTSPSLAVGGVARRMGAEFWPDRAGTLNGAVADALREVAQRGAPAALVLPGDVPLVTPVDLARLAQQGERPGTVVVSPTRDNGTGALLVHPPTLIAPDFGGESAPRHLAAARSAGATAMITALPNLALDLDRPEDLCSFFQLGRSTATYFFLRQLGPDRWRGSSPDGARQMG